jgi:hypothetical protein
MNLPERNSFLINYYLGGKILTAETEEGIREIKKYDPSYEAREKYRSRSSDKLPRKN